MIEQLQESYQRKSRVRVTIPDTDRLYIINQKGIPYPHIEFEL